MKVDIWMRLYISDYLGDTIDLTAEEHGIYLLLLLQYWKKGELLDNIKKLQIITKTNDDSLPSLYSILSNYFTLEQGKYINNRVEKELKNAKSRRETARDNGKKGGRPRKNNNPQETYRLSEGTPSGNPTPNHQKSSSPSYTSKEVYMEGNKKDSFSHEAKESEDMEVIAF